VYDAVADRYTTVQNGMVNETASIIKVDILETRLHQTRGHLSATDRALARRMIEQSDNGAATALWREDGGASGIGAYNRLVGMSCTSLDQYGYWGLTRTCARDQLRLLRVLDTPNSLLRPAARHYEAYLMKHVVRSQAWGVTAGVPAGVAVAVKNGWLPHDGVPWIVNSIGIVTGQDRHYTIAVLTRDDTEEQGITTIQGISRIVWEHVHRSG
jgi:beta-lactamase class A